MSPVIFFVGVGFAGLVFVTWAQARMNQLQDPFDDGSFSPQTTGDGDSDDFKEISGERTIFVVDDDPALLELVSEALKLHGFNVKGYTDPVRALAEFNCLHGDDDLLITDYRMDRMNGVELIDNCRIECPDLRSVMISGVPEEAEKAGAGHNSDPVLAKPFAVRELVELIETTLAVARN
ncbi:MAG: response regulator [Opitutaceae bacterium]|nr:response regulator [Verrucomicrobiales bacterium]